MRSGLFSWDCNCTSSVASSQQPKWHATCAGSFGMALYSALGYWKDFGVDDTTIPEPADPRHRKRWEPYPLEHHSKTLQVLVAFGCDLWTWNFVQVPWDSCWKLTSLFFCFGSQVWMTLIAQQSLWQIFWTIRTVSLSTKSICHLCLMLSGKIIVGHQWYSLVGRLWAWYNIYEQGIALRLTKVAELNSDMYLIASASMEL